jgi:hypothetical protein
MRMIKVIANGVSPKSLTLLCEQLQKSLNDPDKVIVTNFDWHLEVIEIPDVVGGWKIIKK